MAESSSLQIDFHRISRLSEKHNKLKLASRPNVLPFFVAAALRRSIDEKNYEMRAVNLFRKRA